MAAACLAACGGNESRQTLTAAPSERPQAVRTPEPAALFDWAEQVYSHYFPSRQANATAAPYTYRFYPETASYLGVDGDTVAVLGPAFGPQVLTVGRLADFGCAVFPADCGHPVIATQPQDSGALIGGSARLSVRTESATPTRWQWQVSSDGGFTFVDLAGATSADLTLPAANVGSARYRVVASNELGSSLSRQAVLTVGGEGGPRGSMNVSGAAASFSRGIFVPALKSPFDMLVEGKPICVPRNGVTTCTSTLAVNATESGGNGSPLSLEQLSVSVGSEAPAPGVNPGVAPTTMLIQYFASDGKTNVEGRYIAECSAKSNPSKPCAAAGNLGVTIDPVSRVIVFRNVRLTLENSTQVTVLDGVIGY